MIKKNKELKDSDKFFEKCIVFRAGRIFNNFTVTLYYSYKAQGRRKIKQRIAVVISENGAPGNQLATVWAILLTLNFKKKQDQDNTEVIPVDLT